MPYCPKDPFHIYHLLSEGLPDEYQLLVLGRKRTRWYADERNWRLVPPGRFEAGW